MKLSHSKLSCILNNPAEYFLIYKEGIYVKEQKNAFTIGTAVHWGLEHNTSNIDEYWEKYSSLKLQKEGYGYDQYLVEAMLEGYFNIKDFLYSQILSDEKGQKLEILDEMHELTLTGKLHSFIHPDEPHSFLGIIDLLFLTNKGFILIDYKSSSRRPSWDSYLSQLHKYIFLLNSEFPEIPVYKIGIINLRKTMLRQKKDESNEAYYKRLKFEYLMNDDELISYHQFLSSDLDSKKQDEFVTNLSRMADIAEMLDTNNLFYINYSVIDTPYRSQFWEIYNHIEGCEMLYGIKDYIYDKSSDSIVHYRDCRHIDMLCLDNKNILNKYEQFKAQALALYSITSDIDKNELFAHLKKSFTTDDFLLETYWSTLIYEIYELNKK